MQITIYTDGACDIHAENQPGGWAAILRAAGDDGEVIKERVISGGAENTTSNQMELTAVIEGLRLLTRASFIAIVTDSRYVIDVASRKKKALKNKSLWKDFFDLEESHYIEWKHVAGHSGDELNERCDRLAVAEKTKRAIRRTARASEQIMATDSFARIFLSTRYTAKERTTSWASVILLGESEQELSGRLEKTSELEGTLIGAIRSLDSLSPSQDAVIYTAQEYLSKGMHQWLAGWIAKGWKTRGGEDVKYRRHWERLRTLTNGRQIQFRFIKSRDEIPYFLRGKELTAEILSRV